MGSCGLSRGLTLLSCVVCKVSSPYENSYHHGDQVDSGNFAFTAAEDGDYTACFWIPDSRAGVSIVTIEFDWRTGVAAKDWSKVAKKGQVEVMEFELKKLYDTVASIHEEMFYLRERLIPDGLVLTVPQDGTGHYRTVQEAIDAVPLGNTRRTVIRVSLGIYRQPLYVAKTKKFITFVGVRPEDTVFTWNNTATRIEHHQGDRVIGTGTFGCGSIIVAGEDFIAENITFENSSPEGSGQAVAVRVTADRCAFYDCRFLGWQDTLYLHYGKQYLKDCYIEGSVDFIFGNSTALLEHCHIHCKSAGFITAQSRKSPQETTGYVFLRCVITGNGGTSYSYLGRPWGPFGRVVFAFTYMDQCIKHVGWNNWGKFENERSACFYVYRCFGPGCCPSKRVKWARQLMDKEAEQFLMHGFIDPEPKRGLLKEWP